jgi:phospholipid/cholesterol/gamma-HCH transport system substrate-binding protein
VGAALSRPHRRWGWRSRDWGPRKDRGEGEERVAEERSNGCDRGVALPAAAAVAFVVLTAPGGSNGSYTVRAIFADAANLTVGEDVKIAGAKVGKVGTVEPTPEGKPAVVLHIETPGFEDFRADATCEIAPQSLLGEQYVNCSPTQPRPEGSPLPPPLKRIPAGRPGAGSPTLEMSWSMDSQCQR